MAVLTYDDSGRQRVEVDWRICEG